MTTGHPASASRARWTRERLIGLGLGADQIVLSECRLPPVRTESDLTPAQYRPEFAPLVQRLARLLGTGRGISVYVTGGRDAVAPRLHAALQIALGLTPLGRHVVLADSEFLRPGLDGLLPEPLAEGLLDMVRFGRSSRSLLQRPVPEGPWLIPAGSIPAEDPAPLDADGLRSVLYRIAQVCDLALYVGPLPLRDDTHPMVRVCDHVLLASDESVVAPSEIVDALSALQSQQVHVLGAVLVAPIVEAPAAGAPAPAATMPPFPPLPIEGIRPGAPMETPPIPAQHPKPEFPAMPNPMGSGIEPPAAWPPVAGAGRQTDVPEPPPVPRTEPSHADSRPSTLEPRTGLAPLAPELAGASFEAKEPSPRADAPREERPFDAPESSSDEPEPWPSEPSPLRRDPRAARRTTALPDSEFAFDDTAKFSRWPLVVVIVLLATIVFFIGSIFVFRSRNANVLVRTPSETPLADTKPADVPDDSRAAQEAEAKPPADRAAAEPVKQTVPPDDRAAAATSPPTRPPAPAEPTGGAPKPPAAMPQPAATPQSPAGASATTAAPAPDRTVSTPADSPPSPPRVETSPPAGQAATAMYAVHVASYQTLKKANVEIANLRARGYEARAVETDLGSKGMWYRVYAGNYPTAAAAERAREVLLQLPDYSFAQVRRLPRP